MIKARFAAFFLFFASMASAEIDRTCKTCSRGFLDTLNYTTINPIRVNQAGYRPIDSRKIAFVASSAGAPASTTYDVIDSTGRSVWTGALESVGKFDSLKGRMLIRAYNKSISKGYVLGDSTTKGTGETIWQADFGGLRRVGTYRVAVGKDTSHPFEIQDNIYNDVFETSLKFFGAQRCGMTESWFHKDCHTKDGSALGPTRAGALHGGWHDCGDHGKYGETEGYAASMLALAYATLQDRAEDRYGTNYNQFGEGNTDGIDDLLWEARIGADYIYRLYSVSKEEGLVAKGDMYHSVGMGPGMDHLFWDVPEHQEAQIQGKGGPDRPVTAGIGANVAGMYIVSLALVGNAYKPIDPAYSKQLIDAAVDIYDKILIPNRFRKTDEPCCYDGGGQIQDDPAFAAVALWYATGLSRFGYDLYQNTSYGQNPGAVFNVGEFAAGLLGNGPIVAGGKSTKGYFDHGGWTTDFQQNNQMALYAFGKLILKDETTAAKYGIDPVLRDSLLLDVMTGLKRGISIGSNGGDNSTYPGINVDQPYHGVFTSAGWGFNRYNMGMVTELFMYFDLAQTTKFWQRMKGRTVPGRLQRAEVKKFVDGWTESVDSMYLRVGIDNLDYQLGRNPWDISFIMGTGSKNLQHPHNRAANPDGYNAGGMPYDYKTPVGALMGGCKPGQLLKDYWEDYTVTETCIDFSAQLVIPTLLLSQPRPPDTEGPRFKNVTVVMVSDSSALVSWQTDELSTDTLFYSLVPGGPVVGISVSKFSMNKTATLTGLVPKTQYFFWFKGMDKYGNVSRDDNRGRYYDFTTIDRKIYPKIYDVRVCNIRSDRATVFWWTDIPSSSSVEYAVEGKDFATTKKRIDGDDEGLPGRFHKVTLKGLLPGTAYRFDVISGLAKDDSSGRHYRFQTTQDFANYTVKIKATNRNSGASGKGAHYYVYVGNKEAKPYAGVELRLYFAADAATAKGIRVRSNDKAIFGGAGMMLPGPYKIAVNEKIQPYGADGKTWYVSISIPDTLPVSGGAWIELKMEDSTWRPAAFSVFQGGWSFRPHTAPPDPVKSAGADTTHLWAGPEIFEPLGGIDVPTYIEDPYITVHFNNELIYGYPPDGQKPRRFRTTLFDFQKPVPSPVASVRQDSVAVRLDGRTWSFPDVVAAQWQVDAPLVRASSPLAGRTDSVAFAHDTSDAQGTTAHEFAFWGDRDSSYCSCAWQRYLVSVDTMKQPPRSLALGWDPSGPVDAWTGQRKALTVKLLDSAGGVLDTSVLVQLSGSVARAKIWNAASAGVEVADVQLINGVGQIWISDDVADSVVLTASAAVPGSVVAPAASIVRFSAPPPWPVVDSAWTADMDCDGKPDSIRLSLSAEIPVGVAVTSLDLVVGRTIVAVPVATIAANGRILSIQAPSGASGAETGSGRLGFHVATGGRDLDTSSSFAILDRVGPVVLAVSAMERFAPGTDTVRASFSESVVSAGTWPFSVRRAGVPLAAPTTVSVRSEAPDLLEWSLAGADFAMGDTAVLMDPASIRDSSGNPLQTCTAPGAIAIRRRTTPLDGAALVDLDGDGQADFLRLRFRRGLPLSEMPDSVQVAWGIPSASAVLPALGMSRSSDSVFVSAPVAFGWGVTGWSGSASNILVFQGDAASGRRDHLRGVDSVGPVAITAVLRRGGTVDTLLVRVSEPVRPGAGSFDLQKRDGTGWSAYQRFATADSMLLRLVSAQGEFGDGDSIRLAASVVGGIWSDFSGNSAAPAARWIRLQAGDPAPTSAIALDVDGDGRAESVKLTWAKPPKRRHGFEFRALDASGAVVSRSADSSAMVVVGDGLSAVVSLPEPFPFGLTSGFATGTQYEPLSDGTSDALAFPLVDGAGPVAVSANLRYAGEGETMDTLVVRVSEPVVFAGSTLFQVVSEDGTTVPVVGVRSWQSQDGLVAWVVLNPVSTSSLPASTTFKRSDRIRIQPAVQQGGSDALGNPALETGHLVPIKFGIRPPRFELGFHPTSVRKPASPESRSATGDALLVLTRRAGGDTAWSDIEGRAVQVDGDRIGLLVKANFPYDGTVAVFDNLGTFVAGVDLARLKAAGLSGTVQTDPSGQYETWIAWNGTDANGKPVASGVYLLRVILRRDAESGRAIDQAWLNKVYRVGWMVK